MGHCTGSPNKMESAKQEKYNLMHDNPVAKHASGGSWMSKHSKSALHMGYSPLEKKVKVNYKGKELTLDDRSQEYKSIMKAKEGNKQVDTKAVMDKSGTSYTGLTKK
jgi:mannosyltransferase OCH1-like enzyme